MSSATAAPSQPVAPSVDAVAPPTSEGVALAANTPAPTEPFPGAASSSTVPAPTKNVDISVPATTTSTEGPATTTTAPAVIPSLDGHKRLAAAVDAVELPEPQKRVVVQLQEYQDEHLNLEGEYRREWNLLKLKYLEKFQPLYRNRRKALTGSAADDPSSKAGSVETGTQALPNFWLKAMKNHILLAEMIVDHDLPILAYLEDIVFSWVDPNEQASFKLEFYFAPNEYFTNGVLSKTYHLERAEDDDEESVLTRTEGTIIQWTSPEKNVTEKTVTRRQRNRRTNQTRTITEVVEDNSFFNFFQSHEIPNDEQFDTMEESEITELEMIIEAEFEVGCILRDKIIPHALGWYLGIEKDEEAESLGGSAADDEPEDYDDGEELDGDDDEE